MKLNNIKNFLKKRTNALRVLIRERLSFLESLMKTVNTDDIMKILTDCAGERHFEFFVPLILMNIRPLLTYSILINYKTFSKISLVTENIQIPF